MKKIYKSQDEVLTEKQLTTLICSWVFGFAATYWVGIAPLLTVFATEIVFFMYMFYAEFRYTCIKK